MSIKRLAESLNLSKSTVSRALNGYTDVNPRTRERILTAAQKMGYRPNPTARRLASGQSKAIGIVLPSYSRVFISPAFSSVLAGASEALAKHDYQLIVTTLASGQDELNIYRNFISGGTVDGVFVVRTRVDDPRIKLLVEAGFPFVCHGMSSQFQDINWIDVDNADAFYQLVKRQHEFGHRDIAFLDAPKGLTLSEERYKGFSRAMDELQLPINKNWLQHGDLSRDSGYELAKGVLSGDQRPTAILCADDNMAIGVMAACEEAGLTVGKDISIAGYGNYEEGRYCRPTLTTVGYETYSVGQMLAEAILDQLKGSTRKIQKLMRGDIIARDSDGSLTR